MKEFYDKMFDALFGIFILIAITCSIIMIIISVVLTIRTGQHHTSIAYSGAIIAALGVAVSYFYVRLAGGRADETDE